MIMGVMVKDPRVCFTSAWIHGTWSVFFSGFPVMINDIYFYSRREKEHFLVARIQSV